MTDIVLSLPKKAGSLLTLVRENEPRVHCLTNIVAANITANVLLAVGARPSMTEDTAEIAAFARVCDALLVNLGMLTKERREAIVPAVDVVSAAGTPWVLDPVKIGVSPTRRTFAEDLLRRKPTTLRANTTEFTHLSGISPETVSAQTGPVDRIEGGGRYISISNGHHLADRVTAMGCAEGALIAAFLAVSDDAFFATASAILVFNIAAEISAETATGPGSFQSGLLDSLYALDGAAIVSRARLERMSNA